MPIRNCFQRKTNANGITNVTTKTYKIHQIENVFAITLVKVCTSIAMSKIFVKNATTFLTCTLCKSVFLIGRYRSCSSKEYVISCSL